MNRPVRLQRALLLFCAIVVFFSLLSGAPRRVDASSRAMAAADCNIFWNEVLHDTFNSGYRSIVGPTTPGTTVKLRLRVAQSDITSARVRVWNDRTNTETYYPMAWDGAFDTDPTVYDWWFADIPVGNQPTILYYFFELNDNGGGSCPQGSSPDQDFYTDDDVKFYGGGQGGMSDSYNDQKSFQITVYDPAFAVPNWMQRGIVYQIFPDRFRDGNSSNNPVAGRFFYDEPGGIIARSNQANWNSTICDPRGTYSPSCSDKYSSNFYGGDLQGITQKINQGYFDNIGVSVLYLNPIFRSPSNHKYDTADYLTIDPDFGTLADFQNLVAAANNHGIKIILDGVFNHVSSDSTYLDRYSRYDASGNLISPGGVGMDDDSGACEAVGSAFRPWFFFTNTTPGTGLCDGPGGPKSTFYDSWFGYDSLPKLNSGLAQVRSLIWSNGANSVGPYWVSQGASGWRFDVGGDVDPGLTNDPANNYWEGFRTAVRNIAVTGNSEVITLGEEWGDATAWLLGNEWDSVMNYRFRSAVLSWLFTGCTGNGCSGGTLFQDNDSDGGSASGPISFINPSQFNARLRSIEEDYPPMAFKAMMNLEGSHDTNRIRFLLKKVNNDNDSAAVQRMKELWIFSFTYAGAPTLYYGDEIGLSHDGVFSSGKFEDDPYNRAPFPWDDTPGSYAGDTTNLLPHVRKMASIRQSYRALQDGDVRHGLIIDDANKVYGFARTTGSQTALIALNRDNSNHPGSFTGLNAAPFNLPDGTVMIDALNDGVFTVSGGSINLTVNSNWGVVLLEQNKIDTPVAVAGLSVSRAGQTATLKWNPVTTDTGGGRELATTYEVHRSTNPSFAPDAKSLIASVAPPSYGTADGKVSYIDLAPTGDQYYYIVRAFNAAGRVSTNSCYFAFAPSSKFFASSGGNGSINLAVPGGCGWTASSDQSWLTITSSATGTGTDVIEYVVRENFSNTPRQGAITVGSESFTVTQSGAGLSNCSGSISPTSNSFNSSGGTGNINVTADNQCAWQATSSADWIIITSPTSGIGNGLVSYTIAPNASASSRKGTIKIAGRTFSIKQKGN